MCLSRVIEENIFLKTCSRSWRQPCCPAMGWANCESGGSVVARKQGLWWGFRCLSPLPGVLQGTGLTFSVSCRTVPVHWLFWKMSQMSHVRDWKCVVVRHLQCIREGWHILAFAFTSNNSSTLANKEEHSMELISLSPTKMKRRMLSFKVCNKADETRSN